MAKEMSDTKLEEGKRYDLFVGKDLIAIVRFICGKWHIHAWGAEVRKVE